MRRSSYYHYLTFLPNMITLFNLSTGFAALVLVHHGKIHLAAWLVIVSLLWDSLDGNIASIFKNPTQIGRELDSLADMVSFVAAPAFLLASFLLHEMSPGMLVILFLFVGAGAYRLARFNTRSPVKEHFEGLPTPAAGIIVNMVVLACIKNEWTGRTSFMMAMPLLVILLSFLMVSSIAYPKLSAMKFSKWRSLLYMALLLAGGVYTLFNLETALALMTLIFLFFAPLYCLPPLRLFHRIQNAK